MVIKEDRETLGKSIGKYINGEISNFQLMDEMLNSDDMLVREIQEEVEFFLDDFSLHYCEGQKLREAFGRFVLLLKSSYELPATYSPKIHDDRNFFVRLIKVIIDLIRTNWWSRSQVDTNIYWPFESIEEWKKLEQEINDRPFDS